MSEYKKYWNITRQVFAAPEDPEEMFLPAAVSSIVKRVLLFCEQSGSLVFLWSSRGQGKTSLAQHIYATLPTNTYEVMIMSLIKRETGTGWLIPRFAEYFGMSKVDLDDAQEMSAEITRQLDDLVEERRKLVIIIDAVEQIVHEESLEEIHALLGLQGLVKPCISFVLFGTEAFRKVLDRSVLAGRLNFKGKIPSLSYEDLNEYMINQLNRAGLKLGTFNSYAIKELFNLSGGVYALVNAIAENCLMEAYAQNKKIVGPEMVAKAAEYVLSDGHHNFKEPVEETPESSLRPEPPKIPERSRSQQMKSPKQRETDRFIGQDEPTKNNTISELNKPSEERSKPQILDAENLKNIKLSQLFKKGEAS